jgi:MFS family permease
MFLKYKLQSHNIPLLSLSMLVSGAIFFLPIIALYLEENLFTITNVAIIFSIQAVAIAVLEIPTGAIADLFGRKKTLILANILSSIGLIFLYFGKTMTPFIIFAIFNATGRSLWSGTDSALIYDTLKEEKKEKYYKKVIGTYHALWPIGAAVGSVIGGHLAKVTLSLPIILSLIPIAFALILTFFLKEAEYEKEKHQNVFRHMLNSFTEVRKNKQILILFLFVFILFAFGESPHILKALFLEFKNIPVIYFGYIFGFTFALSSVGHYFSHDLSARIGNKNTLYLSTATFALALLIATLTTGLPSVIFIILTSVSFGLYRPVLAHLINIEVASKKRATILSALNFVQQMGVVIVVPFLGYLTDLFTINTAFMISAGLMFSALIAAFFLKERN